MVDWLVYHLGVPYWLAADARQAALLGVVEAEPRFDESRASWAGYAQVYARFAVLKHLRWDSGMSNYHWNQIRAGIETPVFRCDLDEAWSLSTGELGPDDLAMDAELARRVRRVLTPAEWRVIDGLYFADESARELAARCGLSVSGVHATENRALARLRIAFGARMRAGLFGRRA